jgi:hypothetical protein
VTPADRARVAALIDRGLASWRTAALFACGSEERQRAAAAKLCADSGAPATPEDLAALAAVGLELVRAEADRQAVEATLAAALVRALPDLLARVAVAAGRGVVLDDDVAEVLEETRRGTAALRAWRAVLDATCPPPVEAPAT